MCEVRGWGCAGVLQPPSRQPVPPSPFEVQVSPQPGAQKVRAWGPGLEGGVVGRPADFVVEAVGTEVGTLGEQGGHGGGGHCGGDPG